MSDDDIQSPASASKRPEQDAKPVKGRPRFTKPTEFVTLIASAGSDKEEKFVVHKEFTCHYSPVLKAAFSSSFVEGQTQTYKFEDFGNGTIQLLVQWLYYQNLELDQLETKEVDEDEIQAVIELWVLADKLLIPKLQNLVARLLWTLQSVFKLFFVSKLRYVYESTTEGSSLRLLFFHRCAGWLSESVYATQADEFPAEMLIELVRYQITSCQSHLITTQKLKRDDDQGKYNILEGI